MHTVPAAVIAAGSQGRVHAHAYSLVPGVEIVGVADVDAATAAATADRYGARTYTDYRDLIATERPALLSICTPPAMHREVLEFAIEHGVRGVHCEKPVALTYGDARAMIAMAAEAGVLLSINHQRRFDELHVAVKAAIDAGEIGDIVGLEGYCGNLFDWGSHILDLLFFYQGDVAAEAVLAQIDVAARKRVYGALTETAGVVHVRYANGVNGIVLTGRDYDRLSPLGTNGILISGRTGRIEIFDEVATIRSEGRPARRIEASVDDAFRIDLGGANPYIIQGTARAIAELAAAIHPDASALDLALTLDARHGLAAAEVIFASYESSARRGRVTLPLDVDDNALARGLELGYWTPTADLVSTF
jgi:predicted dehydrogenase